MTTHTPMCVRVCMRVGVFEIKDERLAYLAWFASTMELPFCSIEPPFLSVTLNHVLISL